MNAYFYQLHVFMKQLYRAEELGRASFCSPGRVFPSGGSCPLPSACAFVQKHETRVGKRAGATARLSAFSEAQRPPHRGRRRSDLQPRPRPLLRVPASGSRWASPPAPPAVRPGFSTRDLQLGAGSWLLTRILHPARREEQEGAFRP